MAVFTERQAIQQRMAEIREERRELGNEYYLLMDRLRHLDTREKEAVDVDSVVGSLTEAIVTLQNLVPHIPGDALIRQVVEMMKDSGMEVLEPQEQKVEVAPAHVISAQQERDAQKVVTERKRTGRLNREMVEGIIINVLKEHGAPMKLEHMRELVEEKLGQEYSSKALLATVNNLMIKNPKVQKPMRAYYQYQM